MRALIHRLFSYRPSRRSQGGWAIAVPAAVSLATSIFGKNSAKKAASDAASQQTTLANQAQAQYAGQQQQLRNAVVAQADAPNPYQQAAASMHPYYSAPGSDVAMFGPNSPTGTQTTPVVGNPSFTGAPNPGWGQMPPPPQMHPGATA